MAKLYPPPPPNSTPRVQDLNKLEFTLPEDTPAIVAQSYPWGS